MAYSRTEFQTRPRRGDAAHGHMVVFQALEFLRDVVDKIRYNIAGGSATVASGNTLVDVVFNGPSFTAVPSLDITPTTDPGAGMRYWVSNKTTSGFRINLSAAAPVAGVSFDYQAVVAT